MATTTYHAIRDSYSTKIEAIAPSKIPDRKFRRVNQLLPLGEWVESNPSVGVLRTFEIRRTEGGEQVSYQHPDQVELHEEFAVAVVYPRAPAAYGASGMDSMESVMEDDADDIRDVLTSVGNLVAGQNIAKVTGVKVEPGEDVWLLMLTVEIYYYKATSLT